MAPARRGRPAGDRTRRRGASVTAPLLAALALLLGACAPRTGPHPALDMVARFAPVGPSPQVVRPYFANLDALTLVRHRRDLDAVERYIRWYLDHVSDGSDGRPAGLIDDYTVHHGRFETPTGGADSADAYAATFLILCDEFERTTGRREVLERSWARLAAIARLLLELQDADGLVHVFPRADTRYLMDNCEVYGGLVAWDDLQRRLGRETGPAWRAAAERLRRAILDRLFDPAAGLFHWAESGGRVERRSWERFYPDALAQLFPILYGVIDARGSLARGLWEGFASRYDPRRGHPVAPSQRVLIELTREKVLS